MLLRTPRRVDHRLRRRRAARLRLPESPRWLAREGHVDRAREARVRHPDADLSAEFQEILDDVRAERQASPRGWAGLEAAWVRPVGCGPAIFTQLSGIEMIVYDAPAIGSGARTPSSSRASPST